MQAIFEGKIVKKFISRTKLYTFVLAALLIIFAPPVRAQHEGHDMSKMPGMNKPKPKPKPGAKPATAKRRQPTQAKPKQTDATDSPEDKRPSAEPDQQLRLRQPNRPRHNPRPHLQTFTSTSCASRAPAATPYLPAPDKADAPAAFIRTSSKSTAARARPAQA